MQDRSSKEIALSVLKAIFSAKDVRRLSKMRGVVVCGYPGCGKTTIAELLADVWGFERLSSDQIRTGELFKGQHHRHAVQHEMVMVSRYKVYEELARRVNSKLNSRHRVVVDGTNLDQKRWSIMGGMLAKIPHDRLALVVLRTPEWIIKKRFMNRGKKRYEEWWSVYSYWKQFVKDGQAKFPIQKELPKIQIIKPRRYAIRTFDWVPDIKAIIWDVDKTLYSEEKAGIGKAFDERNIKVVQKFTAWPLEKVKKEFWKRYKQIESKTRTLDSFGLNGREEIKKLAEGFPYSQYLTVDKRLSSMFRKLNHLKHYLYTNQASGVTEIKLKIMGLNPKRFEAIMANYDMGFSSKTPESYRKVLRRIKFKPENVLVVGDRQDQDIMPASTLGMRTCIVWGSSQHADVSLKVVYEVAELFGKEV